MKISVSKPKQCSASYLFSCITFADCSYSNRASYRVDSMRLLLKTNICREANVIMENQIKVLSSQQIFMDKII